MDFKSSKIERKFTKWEAFLGRIFLFILSIFFFFLIGEFSYRKIKEFQAPISYAEINDLNHVPRPFVFSVANPKSRAINTLGYKGRLPVMPKPANEKRVFILGGSTVYGNNIKHDYSIAKKSLPFFLERELKENFSNSYKVYNFGISSSIAQQSLVRLILDLVNFNPDLIVSYEGANEFFSNDSRVGYPHRYLFYESNPLWTKTLEGYPSVRLLAFGSQILRGLFKGQLEGYFMKRIEERFFYAKSIKSYTDKTHNYLAAISKMKTISNAFESKFLAVFQPMRGFHFQTYATDNLKSWKVGVFSKSSERKIDLIDFSNILEGEDEGIWIDEMHVKNVGDEIIASKLAPIIDQQF